MRLNKKESLTNIALKTWIEFIDRDQNELNARRHVNYILKKYDNTDYEILNKIKKHKYPKRLY